MIVAIDGPAGAGKSTVARAVAAALGFAYLDTGAMYRAVSLAEDPAAADVRLENGRVLLDGRDVTEEIRTPPATVAASRVAERPDVRAAMVARQRELIGDGDWVAEGRDIGTVVAPDAAIKVFLTASAAERARRRAQQTNRPQDEVLAEQHERDERDSNRAASPLAPAADAVALDTTGLTLEQVVDRVVFLARGLD